MTPDWYEDLAERLIEAGEHAEAMGCAGAVSAFRTAAASALDMASDNQDELEELWHATHGH